MYTVSSAIMTTCLVQREFSLMYTRAHRKPLRVSEPIGIQRSSYFISLPLRYGIPLNLSSAIFHWLISQSYFLARITALLPDGVEDYKNSFSTLGYSPYAIIISEFSHAAPSGVTFSSLCPTSGFLEAIPMSVTCH